MITVLHDSYCYNMPVSSMAVRMASGDMDYFRQWVGFCAVLLQRQDAKDVDNMSQANADYELS